jgi:cytoskeleton bundling-enhancing protein CbeA-like protein
MLKLEWGLQPPEGVMACWGARAIFSRGTIDLLPDRQGVAGQQEDIKPLVSWLNSKGLPAMRKAVKALGADEHKEVKVRSGGFTLVANPRASYGYLYMGAWKDVR